MSNGVKEREKTLQQTIAAPKGHETMRNKQERSSGFTLIEVLIAMLVLAVGLLGLAGLQATRLRNNQRAYNRNQAVVTWRIECTPISLK
jgi:prepilin-type N-terminal cleavage/methylation domain-containing protein